MFKSLELKLHGVNYVKKLPYPLRANVLRALSDGMLIAQGKAQTEYLTGPRPAKLGVVTGRLRSSLYSFAVEVPSTKNWKGILGTNVEYAAIHEFGGKTKRHMIYPKTRVTEHGGFVNVNVGRLVFYWKKIGKWVSLPWVDHPGSKIPARPFLRPGLEKSLPAIFNLVQLAINKAKEEAS